MTLDKKEEREVQLVSFALTLCNGKFCLCV